MTGARFGRKGTMRFRRVVGVVPTLLELIRIAVIAALYAYWPMPSPAHDSDRTVPAGTVATRVSAAYTSMAFAPPP